MKKKKYDESPSITNVFQLKEKKKSNVLTGVDKISRQASLAVFHISRTG